MEEQNYSKRELDEHFKVVNDKLDGNTALTESLNVKVGIQNGRVSKLETKIGGWIIAVGCITFLFAIITSLIVYSFKLSQENLRSSILLEIQNQQ
jgi:hypothetical protein